MKKVWSCLVEVEILVVAETASEAERHAEYLVKVDDGGAEPMATARQLTSQNDIPAGWDGAYPYVAGKKSETIGTDDLTVEQWIEETK